MMSGGGLLPWLGRHPLRPENGAELPRQGQSRHAFAGHERLASAEPESKDPGSVGTGGTHQPRPDTEGEGHHD